MHTILQLFIYCSTYSDISVFTISRQLLQKLRSSRSSKRFEKLFHIQDDNLVLVQTQVMGENLGQSELRRGSFPTQLTPLVFSASKIPDIVTRLPWQAQRCVSCAGMAFCLDWLLILPTSTWTRFSHSEDGSRTFLRNTASNVLSYVMQTPRLPSSERRTSFPNNSCDPRRFYVLHVAT
jgi:hypothetical protein